VRNNLADQMSKTKLFSISFCIAFSLTALLCIIGGYPLIFLPVNYSIMAFIQFGLLIACLSFCLVFINLTFLRFVKKAFKIKLDYTKYYLLSTFIVLQIVTILIGYAESSLTLHHASWFYYYKGVGNSLLYIVTGNLTAFIVAALFAKEEVKLKEQEKMKFDFET
jgi:hypothetical protein